MVKQSIKTALAIWAGTNLTSTLAAPGDVVNLKTTESGIHEIKYRDLDSYGADVSGVAVSEIGLFSQGEPVSIQVIGSEDDPGLFGPGAAIRFIAKTVDTLYTDTNVYTLRLVDQDQTLRVTPEDNAILPNVASATSYLATEEYAPQSEYSFTSPDKNDPWYATRIVAVGQPASETITLTVLLVRKMTTMSVSSSITRK